MGSNKGLIRKDILDSVKRLRSVKKREESRHRKYGATKVIDPKVILSKGLIKFDQTVELQARLELLAAERGQVITFQQQEQT